MRPEAESPVEASKTAHLQNCELVNEITVKPLDLLILVIECWCIAQTSAFKFWWGTYWLISYLLNSLYNCTKENAFFPYNSKKSRERKGTFPSLDDSNLGKQVGPFAPEAGCLFAALLLPAALFTLLTLNTFFYFLSPSESYCGYLILSPYAFRALKLIRGHPREILQQVETDISFSTWQWTLFGWACLYCLVPFN